MQIITFDRDAAQPIELFDSVAAAALKLGSGQGAAHVYWVFFDPGGEIGPHHAGFDQLFLVVGGTAWAAGEDGQRQALAKGQGAYFRRGELHTKGSAAGASVLLVQIDELTLEQAVTQR